MCHWLFCHGKKQWELFQVLADLQSIILFLGYFQPASDVGSSSSFHVAYYTLAVWTIHNCQEIQKDFHNWLNLWVTWIKPSMSVFSRNFQSVFMLMYTASLHGGYGSYGIQYFSNSIGYGHQQDSVSHATNRTHLEECWPSVVIRFLKHLSLLCSRNVTFCYTIPQLSCLLCACSSIFV